MKANRMWLFSDVLEKNKRVFKVPVYQRNYDWTNIQCEKLFQDIMKAGENNRQHFTGTVVYIDDVNGGSGLNEVLIIDGQQRITTMYILLKALYDASKGVSARIEDEVQEVMFNRHCDEKYKVKLKPVKTDNEQLMLLIKDKVDKMDRNFSKLRIIQQLQIIERIIWVILSKRDIEQRLSILMEVRFMYQHSSLIQTGMR